MRLVLEFIGFFCYIFSLLMYKLYKKPIVKVSPDINVPEPKVSGFVVFLIRLLGRIYLFLYFGVANIVLRKDKILFDAFKRALAGESRCIIAFRHPNGGEPQTLTWFFLFRLRALAARKGVRFNRWPHAVFVYGYEVMRWGGWVARFVMPNVGAMPVYHSKMDVKVMNRIYRYMLNGPYPIALAPEGQVTYNADSVPRLEPGAIRIGMHAAQHFAEKNVNCSVEILPLSIHFRFGSWGKITIERLIRHIEKYCGSLSGAGKLPVEERLRRCRDYVLELNEGRYKIKSGASLSFEERIEKVANAALETAERMLGIKSEGDFFFRLYKVRQICWDKIFLPGVNSLKDMARVKRSMKDIEAGEAWYIARHQELADFCWFFKSPIPTEKTPLHNMIEYVQNLWDFTNRTMGGAIKNRISIFPRKVIIHSAPVINMSERLCEYKKDKKDKKAVIDSILSELKKAYLDSIDDMNSTEKG
jgi:hypothetical protein